MLVIITQLKRQQRREQLRYVGTHATHTTTRQNACCRLLCTRRQQYDTEHANGIPVMEKYIHCILLLHCTKPSIICVPLPADVTLNTRISVRCLPVIVKHCRCPYSQQPKKITKYVSANFTDALGDSAWPRENNEQL